MSNITYVSETDKIQLQKLAAEMNTILEKYPFFEEDNMYFVTAVSRCKSNVHNLIKFINSLEVQKI